MRKSDPFCKNCGARLYDGRFDKYFCNAKCKAEWHRNRTPDGAHEEKQPGEVHEEKYRKHEKRCEWCDNVFSYNEYGARGGQRVPQYCSNKCRQAAFRARKKGQDTANGRNQGENAREQKKQGYAWEYTYDRNEEARKQQQQQQQREDKNQYAAWDRMSWWEILEVSNKAGYDAARKAWIELVNKWHPDRHADDAAHASEILKRVNNAHDQAKKYYGKNVRQERR